MRTLRLPTLIFVAVSTLGASTAMAQASDMYNTMAAPTTRELGFAAGSTFMQKFPAKVAGYPTELAVIMGSLRAPYEADVVIKVNDAEVLRHRFTGLSQRDSDYATVFPLKGIARRVNVGDSVSFSITPDRHIAIAVPSLSDSNLPPSPLYNNGNINARFYLRASANPDTSTYVAPVADPIIRSTMGRGGSADGLNAGATFTQTFIAKGSGVPKELGVVMGINQNPFNCKVTVSVRGQKVFDKTYAGVKQRTSDWAAVFPLTEMTAHVNAGDTVTFTVTPDTNISFSSVFNDEVGISKSTHFYARGSYPEFYMKK